MKNSIFKIMFVMMISTLLFNCQNDDNSNTPVTPVTPNAIDCIPVNLQNSLIAFYPFSNGSLNDASGNNYHLTNSTTASPGTDRNGNATCAFHFKKANGDYLEYVNPVFLNGFALQDFSISLWYKNENTQANSDFELLIGRDDGFHCPNTNGQWSIALYDLRKPNFGNNQFSINWDSDPPNSVSVTTSQWRHLVIISAGLNFQIFLDGESSSSFTIGPCGPTSSDIGNLFLGKYFDGYLDDVAIFNRVLTSTEINILKNLGSCCM